MQKLATQVALVLGGALSATPPATPIDGQLWAMSPVAGTVWVFRYNAGSASAYKWEFVGGPALESEVATGEGTSNNFYGTLTTAGPTLTAPRAGDYLVTFGATIEAALTGGWRGMMSFSASDPDAVYASGPGSAGGGAEGAGVSRTVKRTVAAGTWRST
jgi:hypothetical protein